MSTTEVIIGDPNYSAPETTRYTCDKVHIKSLGGDIREVVLFGLRSIDDVEVGKLPDGHTAFSIPTTDTVTIL